MQSTLFGILIISATRQMFSGVNRKRAWLGHSLNKNKQNVFRHELKTSLLAVWGE